MTNKQKQILLMKANGMQSKEIAYQLGLHVRTIEHHLLIVKTELGAKTACQAVAKAIKSGLITMGEIGMVMLLSWSCMFNGGNVDIRRGPNPPSISRIARREIS